MKIIWSAEAEKTFGEILIYLSSKFSEKEADKFYKECYKTIDRIKIEPFLFKRSEINSVHKAVIHKFTTLYYRVLFEEKAILLLYFFETRQNPNNIFKQ